MAIELGRDEVLKEGDRDPRIAELKQMLARIADYKNESGAPADLMDAETVMALKRVQLAKDFGGDELGTLTRQGARQVEIAVERQEKLAEIDAKLKTPKETLAKWQESLDRMPKGDMTLPNAPAAPEGSKGKDKDGNEVDIKDLTIQLYPDVETYVTGDLKKQYVASINALKDRLVDVGYMSREQADAHPGAFDREFTMPAVRAFQSNPNRGDDIPELDTPGDFTTIGPKGIASLNKLIANNQKAREKGRDLAQASIDDITTERAAAEAHFENRQKGTLVARESDAEKRRAEKMACDQEIEYQNQAKRENSVLYDRITGSAESYVQIGHVGKDGKRVKGIKEGEPGYAEAVQARRDELLQNYNNRIPEGEIRIEDPRTYTGEKHDPKLAELADTVIAQQNQPQEEQKEPSRFARWREARRERREARRAEREAGAHPADGASVAEKREWSFQTRPDEHVVSGVARHMRFDGLRNQPDGKDTAPAQEQGWHPPMLPPQQPNSMLDGALFQPNGKASEQPPVPMISAEDKKTEAAGPGTTPAAPAPTGKATAKR